MRFIPKNAKQARVLVIDGLALAFLYVASPFAQLGLVDRAEMTYDMIKEKKGGHDLDAPYFIKDAILFTALLNDGAQLSDVHKFWGTKFSSEFNKCVTDVDGIRYKGSVDYGVEDKAECLAPLIGVDVASLMPDPNDEWAVCSYLERNQLPYKRVETDILSYNCVPLD